MAKQINVSVGGVVKKVKEVPLGIGGVVKKAKSGKCGVGGVVKTFYEGELTVFDSTNGGWQNGFSFGNGTAKVTTSTLLYMPYDTYANGYVDINVPSGFSAGNYSTLYVDMYFNTVSYCNKDDNTDYAWYSALAYFNNYRAKCEINILDDYAYDRRTLELPIEQSSSSDDVINFYTRSMRDTEYAATPATYIYKMWFA